MPYKILQTIEDGELCVSVAPSGWEQDGTLWWPSKSQGSVFDEHSVPKYDWPSYPCVVKKTFKTYSEAQLEAERIQNCALQTTKETKPNDANIESTSEIIKNQRKIIALLEKQSQTQTRILKELAKHENYFTNIWQTISSTESNGHGVGIFSDGLVYEKFSPVGNVDELDNLEENLKDKTFELKYMTSMSNLCTTVGMKGLAVCYRLIDAFFTRHLMTECSWTGSCRSKTNEHINGKIPFKFYTRIRFTFFQIVHKVDPTFSEVDCEEFFKRILRNSLKREIVNKFRRQSMPRNRRRKVRTVAHKEETDDQESSNDSTQNDPLFEMAQVEGDGE